jgi:hypothetical protein
VREHVWRPPLPLPNKSATRIREKEAREKESREKEARQPIWMVPIPIGEFDAQEDKKHAERDEAEALASALASQAVASAVASKAVASAPLEASQAAVQSH